MGFLDLKGNRIPLAANAALAEPATSLSLESITPEVWLNMDILIISQRCADG